MADRYFSEKAIAGETVLLEAAEAHHLMHVMRAKAGDLVVVFDGSGSECQARVERLGRSTVELAVLSRDAVDRELPLALTVGVALPKGDRQKWLVEKLTELGVGRLVPLETKRGVAQPIQSALDRLTRSVVEASKQCGRNRLMQLDAGQSASSFFSAAAPSPEELCWLAHPGGNRIADEIALAQSRRNVRRIVLAVGPEGGFTDEEVALAADLGWQRIDLGPRILRIETAAIALAAICGQFG